MIFMVILLFYIYFYLVDFFDLQVIKIDFLLLIVLFLFINTLYLFYYAVFVFIFIFLVVFLVFRYFSVFTLFVISIIQVISLLFYVSNYNLFIFAFTLELINLLCLFVIFTSKILYKVLIL